MAGIGLHKDRLRGLGEPQLQALVRQTLAVLSGSLLQQNAEIKLFGFDRKVTPEEFSAAVDRSEVDPEAMTGFVNRIPVSAGDVFFVGAGVIHAIGAGCMLLEIQEPTDFTIQPEHWCGNYHLSEQEMYLGLDRETALSCFDFERYGPEVIRAGKKTPEIVRQSDGVKVESLIGEKDTTCFRMTRSTITGGTLRLEEPASVWICVDGEGTLSAPGMRRKVSRGEYFFLPAAAAGQCTVTGSNMTLVCCVGGEQ